jgi:1-acyl-sn-glycerol-3-phosphate acyltransferase
MKKTITKFILRIFGWKVINNLPPEIKKCVVTMAPHTSNWDFLLGWIGYGSLGINSTYLIKKEAFFFPLGPLLKALGAIPVDRKSKNNVVHQVVDLINNSESMFLTITPEGTRSLNRNWKRGYYYIAENANVPLALGFLDYEKKIGGIGQMFTPTGDYDSDLKVIENFYKNKIALHPENFSLSAQNLQ